MVLYDIFPYSKGELSEFEVMHQLPTRTEREDFVNTALDTWNANSTYRVGNSSEKVSIWLPEGILYVSKSLPRDTRLGEMESLGVELSIFKELSNPDAGSREVEVNQGFLTREQERRYIVMPVLWDWGFDVPDYEDPAGQTYRDILDLRSSEVPSHLPIQPKTLTENLEYAAMHAHATDLVGELTNEELRATTPAEGKSTICSQRTLVAVTRLLRDLLQVS